MTLYTTFSSDYKSCGHVHRSRAKAQLCIKQCEELHDEKRELHLLNAISNADAREEVLALGVWHAARTRREEATAEAAAKRQAAQGGTAAPTLPVPPADNPTEPEGSEPSESPGERSEPDAQPEPAPDDDSSGPSITGAMGGFGAMTGSLLERAVDEKVAAALDERIEPLKVEITEKLSNLPSNGPAAPSTITINVNGDDVAELEDEVTHPVFKDALELALAGFAIMLVGPTGCGKTVLGSQLARALKQDFGSSSCSGGISEATFTGTTLPQGEDGAWVFVDTELIDKVENGGLYLMDEADGADPNVLLVLNQLAANGRLPLPKRKDKPFAVAHKDFTLMAAVNTWGRGSNRLYCGRNALDESFLDRFRVGTIEMDYDRELERALAADDALCEAVWKVRSAADTNRLQRVVSTRFIQDAAKARKVLGWSVGRCVEQLVIGWTEDEKRRANVSSVLAGLCC